MTGLEAAFAAIVLAALTKWLNRIRKAVMFPWTAWRMLPDPQAAHSANEEWRGSVDQMIDWLNRRPAHDGWDTVAGAPGYSASQYVTDHLTRVRNLLVRIPDEVFADIRDVIAKGTADGDSTPDIASRIDQILDAGSETWKNRAQTIAVTEVNGAQNAGWFASAIRAQLDHGPMNKRWIATHDTHTRQDHRQADGQSVPIASPFIVGESPLLYPGDKNGPPEQVINCRCTAVVEAS